MKNRLLSSLLSIMTPKRITTQCKFFSFDKTSSLIEELKDKFDFKLNLCKLFYINTLILFNAMKAGFSRCKIHAYYAVSFTYLLSLKKKDSEQVGILLILVSWLDQIISYLLISETICAIFEVLSQFYIKYPIVWLGVKSLWLILCVLLNDSSEICEKLEKMSIFFPFLLSNYCNLCNFFWG